MVLDLVVWVVDVEGVLIDDHPSSAALLVDRPCAPVDGPAELHERRRVGRLALRVSRPKRAVEICNIESYCFNHASPSLVVSRQLPNCLRGAGI
ncbi:hypothetical protein D9M68_869240 [compost metagenome]